MERSTKDRPPYAVASVDHALRLATMLQLEGGLTVTEAANRLKVARSTAHRLLAMLVYRDFAVQDADRVYHAGPVLELAAHSQSVASSLRTTALPHMIALVGALEESSNLIIRTGRTARFIASVECTQALRVGNREGMAFPAHKVTGGLVLLADMTPAQLDALYSSGPHSEGPEEVPEIGHLQRELRKVRTQGFALNTGKSERGVVALGVAVRDEGGTAIAGLSISLPSVRFDAKGIPGWVAALNRAARAIEVDLSSV